jgi:hypothetical protein
MDSDNDGGIRYWQEVWQWEDERRESDPGFIEWIDQQDEEQGNGQVRNEG